MVIAPLVLFAVIISNTCAYVKETVTYEETITSGDFTTTRESSVVVKLNATLSSVEFQFRENDGSFKAWVVFYEKNLQIFKIIDLGERALGEPVYRFNCFVAYFDANLINNLKDVSVFLKELPLDYVIRQIKTLESNTWIMDFVIEHKNLLDSFDRTLSDSCAEADLVLTNRKEIRQLADISGILIQNSQLQYLPSVPVDQFPSCVSYVNTGWKSRCRCQSQLVVGWFPCGGGSGGCRKKNKVGGGFGDDSTSVVCEPLSCRRSHKFIFLVEKAEHCLPSSR